MGLIIAHLSELIVFRVAAPAFLDGVLGLVLIHLRVDDRVGIQTERVQHVLAVHHHVGQLFPNVGKVVVRIAPLEALQQLVCLDGYGLRQVRGRVELIPVPLF